MAEVEVGFEREKRLWAGGLYVSARGDGIATQREAGVRRVNGQAPVEEKEAEQAGEAAGSEWFEGRSRCGMRARVVPGPVGQCEVKW